MGNSHFDWTLNGTILFREFSKGIISKKAKFVTNCGNIKIIFKRPNKNINDKDS